jgi:hypothetical protein
VCGCQLEQQVTAVKGVVAKKTLVGGLALERMVSKDTLSQCRSGSQVVEIVTGRQ